MAAESGVRYAGGMAKETLCLLAETELQEVVYGFNATRAPYASGKLVHELYENQVESGPDSVAVMYGAWRLTYAELNGRANQLARHLLSQGVLPDQVVGICLERGVQMVIGVLAVLKAGGAYLPLDPNYPPERLRQMLEDAAPQVLLTQTELRGVLPATEAKVVALDETLNQTAGFVAENLPAVERSLTSENLVYVIYTSGSTGRPKGTAMRHRSMVNLIEWHRRTFGSGEGQRVLQFAALSFDVAFQEIFSTLCTGGTLVLVDEWVRRDARAITELLTTSAIERLFVPPLMLQSIAEHCKSAEQLPINLKDVITAGEQLRVSTEIRELFRRLEGCRLHNHYGPTETHVVTALTLEGDPGEWPELPAIGRPIANTQIYVLDARMQPVPIGVAGEIYIGGANVARGYLNRPELTEQRFVADPHSTDPEARLYKTGDLGRWRADGVIEYLGRNDDQVKIRGFRVELGEIEAQLARHGQLKEAAVVAREDVPGEKRLVAYVTVRTEPTPSTEGLRAHLKAVLPEHMLPSAFVVLEELPLTPSGKLDRRALPAPDLSAYTKREYEPPRGEVEEVVAAIWQELLHVERVGRNDNFFELGGHSLLIVQMLERLRRVGLSTTVWNVYQSLSLAALARTLAGAAAEEISVPPNRIPPNCEAITPEMLPLIELEPEHIERIIRTVPGGAENVQDIYPLAPLQEGLLFHHLLSGHGADTYLLPILLAFPSKVKLDDFIRALQAVIDRHDVLRSAILWENLPRPVQVAYRRATLPLQEIALNPHSDPVEQLRARMEPERQMLDLRMAPLMRLQIAADPDESRWYALIQLHHITCDHESLELMLAEVTAYMEGKMDELPQPVPYREHVAQSLAYAKLHDADSFFRRKLEDIEQSTAPFGLTDVHCDASRIATVRELCEETMASRVRGQARCLGVSAATIFHAAWALVVSRTTGMDDVVFGTVLLGRLQGSAGAKRTLGMFINTLPLRVRLKTVGALELVEQVQSEVVELLNHEQASLAAAQRCSGVSGAAPLFSTLLNYRHSSADFEDKLRQAGVRMIAELGWSNYPTMFSVDDFGRDFAMTMDTDRRIDPHRMLLYVKTALRSLVEALERAPQTPSLELEVLPENERSQVISGFSATAVKCSEEKLVHQFLEQQVQRTPTAIAVKHEGSSLTYEQLNRQANQLARYLVGQGVLPDQVVGICLERGVQMVIGLLAVLKAGGAYLPLDPNYPPERLRQMLEDAAPQVLLTQTELRGVLPATGAKIIALDETLNQIGGFVAENLPAVALDLTSENLVYVIYTSGSTGRPKGTAMRHRSMVNLIEWHRSIFGSAEGQKVLQFAALSFDVAFQEIFSTLCTGGTLVLVDEWVRRDARTLTELLAGSSIHRLFVPPLMLQSIAEYCKSAEQLPVNLKDVITAGEQLRVNAEIREFFCRLGGCRLHNHYGPTETHVVTALTLEGGPGKWPDLPAIGRPIANTQIYVLDGRMQPVPIGVAGEIYIGGANVARGYLNRPELTEQRFVADPYSPDPEARLYKTGDLGRWTPDGLLEYLGRNDDQVKIRGFRIELGEIETQLVRHEQVKEAAVIAREDMPGEKRLVAYVIARAEYTPRTEELRAHLRTALPEHMVPSAIVLLDNLPLTPSGKLDRRALPAPDFNAYTKREYEPPRGEVEEVVAAIWQELLHVERVGRNDNFFELGGHSLLIVQMLERLRRVGLSTTVRNVYQSLSLAALARTLAGAPAEDISVPPNRIPPNCEAITPEMLPLIELEPEHIEQIVRTVPGGAENVQDIYPLAPLQEGILFHHRLAGQGGDAYVLPLLLSMSSRERWDEFIRSLQEVIDRHDILRTAVLWEQLPRSVQVVYRRAVVPVERLSLDPSRDPLEQLKERMRPGHQRLELARAPLMRLQIAEDSCEGKWYGLLQLHHLVGDHESFATMIAEVMTHLKGRVCELPEPLSFRNHVAQALAYAEAHDPQEFFRKKLAGIDAPTAPFGLLDVYGDGTRIEETQHALDPELARRVRAQARRMGVSSATLFHAAWALVVSRTAGRDDVVFGTVLLGRLHGTAGAQRVLGLFMNTLPLRLRLSEVATRELVELTQREIVELLSYEQASLAVAQRCSDIVGRAPLFTSLLNYRHSPEGDEKGLEAAGDIAVLAVQDRTNYPITLSIDDTGSGFALTAQTDRSVEPQRICDYTCKALRSLVDALEHSPRTPATTLSVLPEAEHRQVTEVFNATSAQYPSEKLIHELIEAQVERTPAALAVEFEGQSIAYADLNSRANRLAAFLRRQGTGPDRLVGVFMERSVELVAALLAVLKVGAAYVPLDPTYPTERIEYMLEDAGPRIILTQQRLRERLPHTGAAVAVLDGDRSISWQDGPADNLPAASLGLHPKHLAYVIYTSGSTGKPKGAMNQHRAVVNRLRWMQERYHLDENDRVLQKTPFSFDVSVWEFFWPLMHGARLIVARPGGHQDSRYVREIIEQKGVTRLHFVPSMLQAFLAQQTVGGCSSLRHIICSGEELSTGLQNACLQQLPRVRLSNLYGPTECAIDVTAWECLLDPESRRVPIGCPIANTRIYILDRHGEPVPIGVPGEIYIGGTAVGRGYLNRPELTAERFVPDPYGPESQARMYKTGDLGCWRPDGAIEYLGRNDHQIKIRGFRIELGEIEAHLRAHPGIQDGLVVAREDAPGEKRLVAYVVARDPAAAPCPEELRKHIEAALPAYMVPSAFVSLERLPLTPNGKLDRRALPAPGFSAYASREYEAPRGETEMHLAAIWTELLHLERLGRQDNFFELGGHSLVATRVASRVQELLGVDLPLRAIFDVPTLAQLAAYLECLRSDAGAQWRSGKMDDELARQVSEMSDEAVLAEVAALERELGGPGASGQAGHA